MKEKKKKPPRKDTASVSLVCHSDDCLNIYLVLTTQRITFECSSCWRGRILIFETESSVQSLYYTKSNESNMFVDCEREVIIFA